MYYTEIQQTKQNIDCIYAALMAFVICRDSTSTVQYSTVQCSTVQYSTVQYSTVQYTTVQYNTVQYSTVQYRTVQYITVQYSTVQYSTGRYRTGQYEYKEGSFRSVTPCRYFLTCYRMDKRPLGSSNSKFVFLKSWIFSWCVRFLWTVARSCVRIYL